MTDNMSSPPMILINHINTHRKPECSSDVVLFADHILKCYHINQYGVALGLEAFKPDFNYNNIATLHVFFYFDFWLNRNEH